MKLREIGFSMLLIAPATLGACATTQPATEQASDSVITGRVGRRLTADPEVKRYEIDVDTLQGVVYLRGKVDSDTMKASAEQIAANTDGVQRVVNELVVDPDTKGDATDGDVAIKARVGTAFSGDDDIRRVNIDVDVIDGVVTLSGIVHNDNEKAQAESLARAAEGVKDVKNDLEVEQHSNGEPEKMGKIDDDGDRKEKREEKREERSVK